MPQKTATFMMCGKDDGTDEIRKFIKDAGVQLTVRNLEDNPLSAEELDQLIGHNPLTYFINQATPEFSELGLDKQMPERKELLSLMAKNPGLVRCPIVKSLRLITVASSIAKVAEMLQISRNGEHAQESDGNRSGRITRRSLSPRK